VNKRTIEKKYKNKFRRVFAKTLSWALGAKVPPSRISFEVIEEDGKQKVIGHYHNYTMTLKIGQMEAADERVDS
jgi:hypothetical protein